MKVTNMTEGRVDGVWTIKFTLEDGRVLTGKVGWFRSRTKMRLQMIALATAL